MYIAINRLQVKPDCGDTIEERFGRPGGLETTPGFLDFKLLKRVWLRHGEDPQTEQIEYLAMTTWNSQEDFRNWTGSPAFKEAHSGPKLDIWAGPAEPAGYDIAVSRSPEGAV